MAGMFAKKERFEIVETFRTTATQHAALQAQAKLEDRELADIIRDSLEMYFAKKERENKKGKAAGKKAQ
jgi:hypothetical protein